MLLTQEGFMSIYCGKLLANLFYPIKIVIFLIFADFWIFLLIFLNFLAFFIENVSDLSLLFIFLLFSSQIWEIFQNSENCYFSAVFQWKFWFFFQFFNNFLNFITFSGCSKFKMNQNLQYTYSSDPRSSGNQNQQIQGISFHQNSYQPTNYNNSTSGAFHSSSSAAFIPNSVTVSEITIVFKFGSNSDFSRFFSKFLKILEAEKN